MAFTPLSPASSFKRASFSERAPSALFSWFEPCQPHFSSLPPASLLRPGEIAPAPAHSAKHKDQHFANTRLTLPSRRPIQTMQSLALQERSGGKSEAAGRQAGRAREPGALADSTGEGALPSTHPGRVRSGARLEPKTAFPQQATYPQKAAIRRGGCTTREKRESALDGTKAAPAATSAPFRSALSHARRSARCLQRRPQLRTHQSRLAAPPFLYIFFLSPSPHTQLLGVYRQQGKLQPPYIVGRGGRGL